MNDFTARSCRLMCALLVPCAGLACSNAIDDPHSGAGSSSQAPVDGGSGGSGGALTGTPDSGGGAGHPNSSGGRPGGGAGSAGAGGSGTSAGGGRAGSTAAGVDVPETTPTGYGKATSGGDSVQAVTVRTMAEVQLAIDEYSGAGGLVLEYAGTFDFDSIADPCLQHLLPPRTVEIKGKKDITVLGRDGSSANFGFHIAGASGNVIIRNMTIGLTPGGDASDIVSVEGMSSGVPKDIWIDHNEFYTSMAVCPGAGDTAFDGMIDVKKGADNITVSYNYLHDHHKVSLNGFTDDDAAVRHITFHHNLFENIGSRGPLQRHGYSHVFNNYFSKVSASCVNVRMGGYSLVESNYFETVQNPVTARDSSAIGYWDLRNNNLASAADVADGNRFGITWDDGNAGTVNAIAWTTTQAFPEALGYSYQAQPFQCIHDGLRAVAGASKGLATLKCK